MLGAARRAVEGDRIVRSGGWDFWSPSFMVGKQVSGQRLGIIGMGRVGKVMAKRARGFDMEVHYFNRSRMPAELEQGAVFHETVESLLGVADFLSLHCPATPETTGMMNAERFALLPEGAVFVNTARGALVDEDALLAALGSGKVATGLLCDRAGWKPRIFRARECLHAAPYRQCDRSDPRCNGFSRIGQSGCVLRGRNPKGQPLSVAYP
jgi:lactate dehydrogenase-like 2-hydroxyacid dehydrogenase